MRRWKRVACTVLALLALAGIGYVASPAGSPPASVTITAQPRAHVPQNYVGSLVLSETGAKIASDPAWWGWPWGGGTKAASGSNLLLTSTGSATDSGYVWSTTRFWKTGIFEFHVDIPKGPNGKVADWPALWFSGRPWPQQGEIDLFEGLSGTDQVTYHFGATAPGSSRSTSWKLPVYSPRPGPGWHYIDLVWAPSWARVYVDGRLFTILSGSWFRPGPEMLRLQVNSGYCPGTTHYCGDNPGSASSLVVASVHVWKFK